MHAHSSLVQAPTDRLCLFRAHGISFFLTFPNLSQLLGAPEYQWNQVNTWNHCLFIKASAALQIRCGAVKAVPGGFDSHALPPPPSNKTPGIIPGVFVWHLIFSPINPLPQLVFFTHFVYGMFWVSFQWEDVNVHQHWEWGSSYEKGSITVFWGAKRVILGSLAYIFYLPYSRF